MCHQLGNDVYVAQDLQRAPPETATDVSSSHVIRKKLLIGLRTGGSRLRHLAVAREVHQNVGPEWILLQPTLSQHPLLCVS